MAANPKHGYSPLVNYVHRGNTLILKSTGLLYVKTGKLLTISNPISRHIYLKLLLMIKLPSSSRSCPNRNRSCTINIHHHTPRIMHHPSSSPPSSPTSSRTINVHHTSPSYITNRHISSILTHRHPSYLLTHHHLSSSSSSPSSSASSSSPPSSS